MKNSVPKAKKKWYRHLDETLENNNNSWFTITDATLTEWGLTLSSLGVQQLSDLLAQLPIHYETQQNNQVRKRFTLIDSIPDAEKAIQELLKHKILAVDLEGEFGETYNNEIWMIQVGTPTTSEDTPHAFLFDTFREPKLVQVLRQILEDETIRKVFHDCRRDCFVLKSLFNVTPKGLVDSQICFALIQSIQNLYSQQGNHQPKRIGLNNLLDHCGSPSNINKSFMHNLVKNRAKFHNAWKSRPMDKQLLLYAAEDVLYLADAFVKLEQELYSRSMEALVNLSSLSARSGQDPSLAHQINSPKWFQNLTRLCREADSLDSV
jgi:hypothetical protein